MDWGLIHRGGVAVSPRCRRLEMERVFRCRELESLGVEMERFCREQGQKYSERESSFAKGKKLIESPMCFFLEEKYFSFFCHL